MPGPAVSYGWDQAPKMPNVADWDWVVMDLSTLPKVLGVEQSMTLLGGNLSGSQFGKLVTHGGGIVVIVGDRRAVDMVPSGSIDLSWWWPDFRFTWEAGTTKQEIASELSRYFQYVTRWNWTVRHKGMSASAKNKNGEAIAASVQPVVKGRGIHVVPKAEACASDDGIMILLEDICGLRLGPMPAPAWASGIPVPGQGAIEAKLTRLVKSSEKLGLMISKCKSDLDEVTSLRRLLYEEGHTLEAAVKAALTELGATVRLQDDDKDEDAIIDCSFGVGALEVKKRNSSASKADVRQLDEWVGKLLDKGEDPKGILAMNHYAQSEPAGRGEPFPDNVVSRAKTARRRPFCLMTTPQLFEAICNVRGGKLSAETVLKAIYEANGPYEPPPLLAE